MVVVHPGQQPMARHQITYIRSVATLSQCRGWNLWFAGSTHCYCSHWDSLLQPYYNNIKKRVEEITCFQIPSTLASSFTSDSTFGRILWPIRCKRVKPVWYYQAWTAFTTQIFGWHANEVAITAVSHPLVQSTLSKNSSTLKGKHHSLPVFALLQMFQLPVSAFLMFSLPHQCNLLLLWLGSLHLNL